MSHVSAYRFFGAFRLLLAIMVLVQHFGANLAPEELALLLQPYEVGSVAVLAFFALSGFVIFEAADRIYSQNAVAFFANRLLRIVPQLVVAVTAAILIFYVFDAMGTLRLRREEVWVGDVAFKASNIIANLFGFLPVRSLMTYDFVDIGWTVRIEMVFYMAVAAAILMTQLAGLAGRQLSLRVSGLVVAMATVPLAVHALAGKQPAMFQFVPHFVFGAALYLLVTRGGRAAGAVVAVSFAGILAQFFMQPSHHPTLGFERALPFQLMLLFVLLGLMTFLATARFPRLLHIDRFLGDVTYAFYLWHLNVMIVALSVTKGYSYTTFVISILASLVAALIPFWAIESNLRKLRDSVRGGRLDQLFGDPGAMKRAQGGGQAPAVALPPNS
jgi:peptidoglycan/LPS O-acetylase OafA/YrhL